ncbi:MAG: hypothetical protein U0V75_14415 [Ferruginibacter sp.]
MNKLSLLILLMMGILPLSRSQTIYYVDVTRANNSGAGTSWATAKKDLQVAINAAVSGDQVWVKAGTYLPTHDPFANAAPANNRDKAFSLKSGVSVYGGFAGTETQLSQRNWRTNITTLSGDLGIANTLTDNAYHVVLAVNNSGNTMDGFIISKGYATAPSGSSLTVSTRLVERFKGGGIYNVYSSTSFSNCIIRANSADCTDNNDDSWGAGVLCDNSTSAFTACMIDGNSFLVGGNSFGVFGAGMNIINGACTISNCAFVNNTSGSGFLSGSIGGALYLVYTNTAVVNCVFFNNAAQNAACIGAGGAGSNTSTVTNCTFAGNTSSYAGVSFQGFAKMVFRNSIFWNNSPTVSTIPGRDEVYSQETMVVNQPSFINCLIRDASGSPLSVTNAQLTSCLNNFPNFNNLSDGDGADNIIMTADDGLRLQCTSVAIGAGTGASPVLDILNLPRTGVIDMGAYEGGHLDGASNTIPTGNSTVQLPQNAAGISNYSDCVNQLVQVQSGGAYTVSGPVTARVWIEAAQPSNFVKRHYEITPDQNAGTASGRVTLYFKQQEFTDFNAVNTVKLPTGPADAAGIANILVEKRGGTSGDGSGLPGSYSGTIQTISNASLTKTWNASAARWEISFDVTGFSGFFLKTQLATLPVQRLDFYITAGSNCNQLRWNSFEEINTKEFVLEKSDDGIIFYPVATIAAAGSGNNQYQYQDCNAADLSYYRLRITDRNGTFSYSRLLVTGKNGPADIRVQPNPVKDNMLVLFDDRALLNTPIKVSDATGRLLVTGKITRMPYSLTCGQLSAGIYYLQFANGKVIPFVKE